MARRIDTLLVIAGDLVAETPIHVGGIGGAVETDLPLAVDGRGRFYIPGTSLAGAIRAYVDRAPSAAAWSPPPSEAADGKKGKAKEDDYAPGQGPSREVWGHGRRGKDVEAIEAAAKKRDGKNWKLRDEEKAWKKRSEGIASRVIVHDAYIDESDFFEGRIAAEMRDHVGIDRESGTAAGGIKYDRQILPKRTRLAFHMEVELAPSEATGAEEKYYGRSVEGDRARVAAAIHALCNARIRFGGAKTRGLGKLRLVGATLAEHNVKSRDGVLGLVKLRGKVAPSLGTETGQDTLTADRPSEEGETKEAIEKLAAKIAGGAFSPPSPPVLRITIDWQPDGPVMVKSSADGLGVDMLPLVSGVGADKLAMVMPGSAIKGRLRSHAETIALTLGLERRQKDDPQEAGDDEKTGQGSRKPKSQSRRDRFLKQLTRSPLVETLFGVPGAKQGRDKAENDKTKSLGLGTVYIDDCFATERRNVTRDQWEALMAAPKDQNEGMDHVRAALEKMNWATKDNPTTSDDPATHVAIDRWTGGAADGLLYSALEPRGVEWSPIVIEVALDRLNAPSQEADPDLWRDAAVALLFLTLKDFALGRVPLGFGGNRGYGSVRVTEIKFETSANMSQNGLAELDGFKIAGGGTVSDEAKLKSLDKRWQEFQREWEGFGEKLTPEAQS